jgi:hypothetical protein
MHYTATASLSLYFHFHYECMNNDNELLRLRFEVLKSKISAVCSRRTWFTSSAIRYSRDRSYLDNVTLYSAKVRNPTQVATMTAALDLGVNRRSE